MLFFVDIGGIVAGILAIFFVVKTVSKIKSGPFDTFFELHERRLFFFYSSAALLFVLYFFLDLLHAKISITVSGNIFTFLVFFESLILAYSLYIILQNVESKARHRKREKEEAQRIESAER